tara:strand:+ start:552 stop:1007 length:456 start_codon:yes stop_codon:yes gene_type:complete
MLTPEMEKLIREHTIGLVATVTPEGMPSVSPKATTMIISPQEIVFCDIRSPKTRRNIESNQNVEINYINVFSRQACRVTGVASYISLDDKESANLKEQFKSWDQGFLDAIRGFFRVKINKAQLILSPVYDRGANENDLKKQWLSKYTELLS